MPAFICETCGVQAAESQQPPPACPICLDERQYVGWQGQRWTTLADLRAAGYTNHFEEQEPGLTAVVTRPAFAIGQRALLLQTAAGNIFWDCLSFLDEATVAEIERRGGLRVIAISHPHFYGTCVEWSRAFGGARVYIHAADRRWVTRPDERIVLWEGDTVEPLPGVTLINLGGHFDGATILHWPAGAGGRGAMLTGDTIQVVRDRRYVSFMYSYPNLIPLPAAKVEQIAAAVRPYPFTRIYGAFPGLTTPDDPDAVEHSARRYVQRLQGLKAPRPARRPIGG